MSLTPQQIKEIPIIIRYLIQHIRSCGKNYYITYQDLVDECNLPYGKLNLNPTNRKKLGIVLAKLLLEELDARRPLLTSIVYGKGLYRPRNGFYKTLEENNIKDSKGKDIKQLYEIKWRREIEKEVVTFWESDENYNKYKKALLL